MHISLLRLSKLNFIAPKFSPRFWPDWCAKKEEAERASEIHLLGDVHQTWRLTHEASERDCRGSWSKPHSWQHPPSIYLSYHSVIDSDDRLVKKDYAYFLLTGKVDSTSTQRGYPETWWGSHKAVRHRNYWLGELKVYVSRPCSLVPTGSHPLLHEFSWGFICYSSSMSRGRYLATIGHSSQHGTLRY